MAVKPVKSFKGYKFDPVTADALEEVDKLLPKVKVQPTQGSYSTSVAASAGTHDGGGAGDLHARTLDEDDRDQLVYAMRVVGFAAWIRNPNQGPWVEHCHFVRKGCADAAPLAKAQVEDYYEGKNGLKGHAKDDGPSVGVGRKQTFEQHMKRAGTKVYASHINDAAKHDLDEGKRPALHPNEVYALERALVREGLLRIEALDGTYKQASRDAFRKYYKDNGLDVAGAIKKLGKAHGFETAE